MAFLGAESVTSTCPSEATKLGVIACLFESPHAAKKDTSTAKAMRFFMKIPYKMFKLLYLIASIYESDNNGGVVTQSPFKSLH